MASAQQPCRLLSLPLELRLEIYNYLTTESFVRPPNYLVLQRIIPRFANLSSNANGSININNAVDLPLRILASTCRQIEHESRQIIQRYEPKRRLMPKAFVLPESLQYAIATEEDDADDVFLDELLRSPRRGFFRRLHTLYLDAHSDIVGAGRLATLCRRLEACKMPLPRIQVLVWNDNEAQTNPRPRRTLSKYSYYDCNYEAATIGKTLATLEASRAMTLRSSPNPRLCEFRACVTRGLEVVHAQQEKPFGPLTIMHITAVVFPAAPWLPKCITWEPFDITAFGNSSGFELFKIHSLGGPGCHADNWYGA